MSDTDTPLDSRLSGAFTRLSESTEGPHPFWWADCTRCPDKLLLEYGDLHELTRGEAHREAERWCESHSCHPAGRGEPTTPAEQFLEDTRADAMFGEFEDDAA